MLGHLLDLLRSLSAEDWGRPTVCSAWLDGDHRRLATRRDGSVPPDFQAGFASHEARVAYLHRRNAEWPGWLAEGIAVRRKEYGLELRGCSSDSRRIEAVSRSGSGRG